MNHDDAKNALRQESEDANAFPADAVRAAFDAALTPLIVYDLRTRARHANAAFLSLLGCAANELATRNFDDLVHPDDRAAQNAMRAAILSGEQDTVTTVIRTRDGVGTIRAARVRVHAVREPSRELRFVVSSFEDITEAVEATTALERERDLLRTILDALQAAVSVRDADGKYRVVNREAAARLGAASPAEAIGKTTYDFLAPERAAAVETALAAIRRSEASAARMEVRLPSAAHGGEERTYVAYTVPLTLEDGSTGTVSVATDVTELHRANETVRELGARLIEISETQRRAIAQDLHDRAAQSLAALAINLDVIEVGLTTRARSRIAHRLADARRLVQETVAQVRDIMTELRPLALDELGFAAALRGYCDQFTRRTGIASRVDCDDASLRLTALEETVLFRIAQEAISNAARHSRASALAVVVNRPSPDEVFMSVRDDGVGFDPNAVTTHEMSGWGLRGIRERALAIGADARIESAPGRGTTVAVTVRR